MGWMTVLLTAAPTLPHSDEAPAPLQHETRTARFGAQHGVVVCGEQAPLLHHRAFLGGEQLVLEARKREQSGEGQEDQERVEEQQPPGDAGERQPGHLHEPGSWKR